MLDYGVIGLVFAGVLVLLGLSGIRIVKQYERGVVFRFGRIIKPLDPGFRWVLPLVDRVVIVSTRIVAADVPDQDVITRDNVSLKVNAVVYFRVVDPIKAVIEVEDYLGATSKISQTTLRSVLGQSQLDDLLADRDKVNHRLQTIIDEHTGPWGVQVTLVEVKQLDLPEQMQRAMASQAEAERERRAKVIAAEGEFQSSTRLREAADIMSGNSQTLQLRYLQTLAQIATERNSTIVFPIPIEFLKAMGGIQSPAS
jgi:regulator of protease activity HflC (stomatin/prohibitin superfamily)